MKVTVPQSDLAQALRAFSGLKLVRMQSYRGDPAVIVGVNGSAVLKGTDLTTFVAIQTGLPLSPASAGPEIVVSKKAFESFIRCLPKRAAVHLGVEPTALHVQSGDVEMQIEAKLAEDVVHFPELLAGTEAVAEVGPAAFREAILDVVYAASDEDARPALSAVFTRLHGAQLTLVAADGFRLATRTLQLSEPAQVEADVLVPARTMGRLARLLAKEGEPVRVFLRRAEEENGANAGYDWVAFQCGSISLGAKLVEARYPDYEAIIPRRYDTRLVVPREDLLRKLRMLAPLVRDQASIVVLEVGEGTLTARNAADTARFPLTPSAWEGAAGKVGFNVDYLTDAVGAVDGEGMVLELQRADWPGVLRVAGREDFLYVLMPMQI